MTGLATSKPRPAGRTYTCLVAEKVAADDNPVAAAANVDAHFADESNSNRALGEWLGVSEGTAAKHRNNVCVCAR